MTGFGKLQFVSARVKVRHSRRVLRLAGIDRETDAWKANAGRSAQRDRIPLGFTAPTSPATPFTPHGVVEGADRVQPRDRRAGPDPCCRPGADTGEHLSWATAGRETRFPGGGKGCACSRLHRDSSAP